MYDCLVLHLFRRSFSTLLQPLQQVETLEPCNFLYEEVSETSRIPLYNTIVHYSNVLSYYDDSQRFSTFSVTRDLLKAQ